MSYATEVEWAGGEYPSLFGKAGGESASSFVSVPTF